MLDSTLFLVGEYTIFVASIFLGFAGNFVSERFVENSMLVREYTSALMVGKKAN